MVISPLQWLPPDSGVVIDVQIKRLRDTLKKWLQLGLSPLHPANNLFFPHSSASLNGTERRRTRQAILTSADVEERVSHFYIWSTDHVRGD